MIRINLDEFGFEGEVVVNKGIVEKINKFFGWEDEEKVIRHIESDIVDMLEENEGEFSEELVFAKEDKSDASSYEQLEFVAHFEIIDDKVSVKIEGNY